LREDSSLGVAGLVSAAATGNVALANPLGSVLAETPALKAYLPALCRHFFGEDLKVDSVPTLWCGDARSLSQVLASLHDFVIKPAFGDRRGDPIRPALMDREQRSQLMDRLRARPGDFVAERWPGLSSVPVLEAGSLASGELAWRAFLCRDGDDYDVMPGGLARINEAPDGVFLAIGSSAASKDVWIPSVDPAIQPPLPSMPDARVELRRGGLDLPSRLLDDIYWLGRYVERCDCTARLARAGFDRSGSEAGPEAPLALHGIFDALHRIGVAPSAGPPDRTEEPSDEEISPAESLLLAILFANDAPHNLRSILRNVHQLTLSVRSRLSRDAWHVLRRLTSALDSVKPADEGRVDVAVDTLNQLLITLAAASGTTLDNMVRGHAWMFLDMGRRVERAAVTLTLLQSLLPAGASRVHMEALLEIGDSLLTYRARYLSSLQVAPVVDLLLTDDTNPRSLAFQIDALQDHLKRLPGRTEVVRTMAERRLIALQALLRTADIERVCAGDGQALRDLLESSTNLVWQFSDEVGHTWFSHMSASRALSPPQWVNEDLEVK